MHADRKGEARRSHRDYPSGGIRLPLTGIIPEWIRGIILSKWIIWIIWGGWSSRADHEETRPAWCQLSPCTFKPRMQTIFTDTNAIICDNI
jgi:hypothetical protein